MIDQVNAQQGNWTALINPMWGAYMAVYMGGNRYGVEHPLNLPLPRAGFASFYDAVSNGFHIFGGYSYTGNI
jgi:hypothetical protein